MTNLINSIKESGGIKAWSKKINKEDLERSYYNEKIYEKKLNQIIFCCKSPKTNNIEKNIIIKSGYDYLGYKNGKHYLRANIPINCLKIEKKLKRAGYVLI